ncbi:MAG TPA: hypothetical protein VF026_32230 [Ktedonobacteraceae bacterium]
MAKFDFIRKRVSIVDDSDRRLDLNPQEALDLLQWLSEHRDALYRLARQDTAQGQSREKRLEIHIYQENLEHVDKLKAAIPSLHEYKPVVKVLDTPMDLVTERAIELLKELQVEYKIHPLLEEDNAFSQG